MAWIEKPNKKDFKDIKEFEAAMAEFKKAMAEKKKNGKQFTSPTTQIENDAEWHGANTDFGKDVGSVSFNHRVGDPFIEEFIDKVTGSSYAAGASNKNFWDSECGIVAIDLVSTLPKKSTEIGYSTLLNQVMNKFNAQVRKANAGAKNYEPVDLLIYNLAYSEAACYYATCCRLYGGILNYEKRNAYFAEAYVRALGGNYSDLKNRLPEFRAYLKSFATRLNGLTAIELPYFKRKVVLCSNTYKDEKDGYNCQIYIPRFRQWLIYEVDPNNGSTLRSSNNKKYYTSWNHFSGDFANLTLDAIMELGDYMLNQLLTDADVATMSGDILKRYEGTNSIVNLAWIDENYYVMPQYSEEFLEEFENCSMPLSHLENHEYTTGDMYNGGGHNASYQYQGVIGLANPYFGEITQNGGNIVQVNMFDNQSDAAGDAFNYLAKSLVPRTINFKNGETSPSRVMTATRLLSTAKVEFESGTGTDVNYSWGLGTCDTEIVIRFTVYTKVNSSDLGSPYAVVFEQLTGQAGGMYALHYANALAQFKYLPPFITYTVTTNSDDEPTGITVVGVMRNLDKAAVISTANLDNLVTCSSMYEFGLNEDSTINK